jgi:hypothetical protein
MNPVKSCFIDVLQRTTGYYRLIGILEETQVILTDEEIEHMEVNLISHYLSDHTDHVQDDIFKQAVLTILSLLEEDSEANDTVVSLLMHIEQTYVLIANLSIEMYSNYLY